MYDVCQFSLKNNNNYELFISGQCCALSFIEKLDAQALSMSQEEFNR